MPINVIINYLFAKLLKAPYFKRMNVINAIFPVMFLLGLGSFLKKTGITNDIFLATADKLVYYIFFPAMLFWKIGSAPPGMDMSLGLCLAGLSAVLLVYLASLFLIRLLTVPRFQAGAFSQACYRFNTYIGMAIVMNTLGEEGVRLFGVLIGVAIPVINVLAVSTLIWHSGRKEAKGKTIYRLGRALVANPLILACAAGLLFSRTGLFFPRFIDNTFYLMTAVTMPLALMSIGGALSASGLRDHFRLSMVTALAKGLVLPVAGFFTLALFHITGTAFKAGMIFFALPTSTAIYVLSSQLNSDTDLASASIMVSTLLSFLSLSVVILFFI